MDRQISLNGVLIAFQHQIAADSIRACFFAVCSDFKPRYACNSSVFAVEANACLLQDFFILIIQNTRSSIGNPVCHAIDPRLLPANALNDRHAFVFVRQQGR